MRTSVCGGKVGADSSFEGLHATGVVGVFVEGHDGVAVVVRFLDEGLAFAGDDEAPDVVRAGADDLELAAIGSAFGPCWTSAESDDGIAAGFVDFAVVEKALRHPDPAAGCPRELMRKEVRAARRSR